MDAPPVYQPHNPTPEERILFYGDHEYEEAPMNFSTLPLSRRQTYIFPQQESYYKNMNSLTQSSQSKHTLKREGFSFEFSPKGKFEPLSATIEVDRIKRPQEEQRLLHSYLSIVFLILSYSGLLMADIYYQFQLASFRKIEGKAVKVKDVSKVWPENNGQLVYIRGFVKYPVEPAIQDEIFGLTINAPLLIREVQMYQWVESGNGWSQKLKGLQDAKRQQFTYRKEWSQERMDSALFKSREYQNPDTFGVYQNLSYTPSYLKVGGYHLDKKLTESLFTPYLDQLIDIERYFPQEQFEAPQDLKGQWTISERGDCLERRKYPGRDSVGDLKVMYYAVEPEEINERMMVSMMGRQKDKKVDSEDKVYFKMGDQSINKLMSSEKSIIYSMRRKVLFGLLTCIMMFQYSILRDEMFKIWIKIPFLGDGFELGWVYSSMIMTAIGTAGIVMATKILKLFI